MNNELLFAKINEGILEERYRAFNINLEKNLSHIHKSGGLKNIIPGFKDKHVIIAGAGSSLEQYLGILKKYQHRDELVIIAIDMTLLPLYNRGIFPKYVISCETTPVDYFSNINTKEMHLLAFSCISNTNLRKWRGPVSFYNWMIHNEIYDRLWQKAGVELGFVATCSIVTTQAVSIVLGCDIQSLMLIGNDMGFKTEYYIKGTLIYRNNLYNINRFASLETSELNKSRIRREFEIHRGNQLFYTNSQFIAAKNWLEDLFKQISIPVYESNDLGCSPQYIQKISLKKYMERFERRARRRR